VRQWVEKLRGGDSKLLAQIVPAVLSLVFEGAGIHFLQDGFSGGHVRTRREGRSLQLSRYEHDFDSEHGVLGTVMTARGPETLMLYGDGYLLGRLVEPVEPHSVTARLIERQRAKVFLASTATLLDWASDATRQCDESASADRRFICSELPTTAPRMSELGTLPLPPPPFTYQSLLVSTSIDGAGNAPQFGVRAVFLSQLGSRAQWMTSYNFGVLTRLGQGPTSQVLGEFAYMFHWRWAARFLLNAGPFAYFGFRNFQQGVVPFAGIGSSCRSK
jgi:hypothetical protein